MIKSGFFSSFDESGTLRDRLYSAEDFGHMFDGILKGGIFESCGDAFSVRTIRDYDDEEIGGLELEVKSGRCWFEGRWMYNDAPIRIRVKEPAPVLDRIDAVVIDVDPSVYERSVTIKMVEGIPAESNPQRPTLLKPSEPEEGELPSYAEHVQYALCYIYVHAGSTSVSQTDITDVRGTDETPFASGIMQQLSIEELIAQWEAEWAQTQQSKTEEFTEAFETWFDEMKGQLSEDAAGNLQLQINEINTYLNSIGDAEQEEF